LSLINELTIGYQKLSGKVKWMLDGSASSHMTGDMIALKAREQIASIAIGLQNRTYTMACEKHFICVTINLQSYLRFKVM